MLLVERLRNAGVPVSTTELIDAYRTTENLGVSDRELWRAGLSSSLIKRAEHLPLFVDLFNRTFPLTARVGVANSEPNSHSLPETPDGTPPSAQTPLAATAPLRHRVEDALTLADPSLLRDLAAEAVDSFASLNRGGSSERQYLQRVMRALELGELLHRALRRARSEKSGFELRLALAETTQCMEEFRGQLAREIAMRLALLSPIETITTVKYPDDVAFLETSAQERAELRRAIEPLARKLAAGMARRRRIRRTGKVDVRRTARRSLAFGGVPLEPKFKSKRATRPEVIVLCDVSGSVADFAHFILSLMHALHEKLDRLRTFVFVDGIAEVTALFNAAQHELMPMHLVTQPGVVRGNGHSDYGAVLDEFLRSHAGIVRPTSTIIIAGDGRSNFRDPRADSLRKIAERANAVYWLNPEPESDWNKTDSEIATYRPSCAGVYEVRTTRQLVAAVLEIDARSR